MSASNLSAQQFADLSLQDLMATVEQARARIRGFARLTPCLPFPSSDSGLCADLWLKCESLQRGGAFKIRGASNAISQIPEDRRSGGIVTYSSGNHAQAVAIAGGLLGAPVTVVMPHDASAVKREATIALGAEVVGCDVSQREAVADDIARSKGAAIVPPFDHPDIIVGQGTLALEMLEQAPEMDAVLVPVGGGGLISGVAIAVKALRPGCKVIGVEPDTGDDAARSLSSGSIQTAENCRSVADGTRTRRIGAYTFHMIRRLVDDIVTVSEAEIAQAVRLLFTRAKLVVEPSGALGVAAIAAGRCSGVSSVGVVLSGGNIEPSLMSRVLLGEI